mgnify:CR=1 FL=1
MTAAIAKADRRTASALASIRPAERSEGLDGAWDRLAWRLRARHRSASSLRREASRVITASREMRGTDSAALAEQLHRAAPRLIGTNAGRKALSDALATAHRLAAQTTHLEARPNQVAAALALLDGSLAELATGEGKTLSAALAAVIEALRGSPCHVVTANDYLARRDAEWIEPLIDPLGLRAASVTEASPFDARSNAYRADICYGTAREFTADFLRARLAIRADARRAPAAIRALCPTLTAAIAGPDPNPAYRLPRAVIVDEADFVLIDDAITPLILSSRTDHDTDPAPFRAAREVADTLKQPKHFVFDQHTKRATLTQAGRDAIDRYHAPFQDHLQRLLPRDRDHLVTTALAAAHGYREGVDYAIIQTAGSDADHRIAIIDPATGRPSTDRTWQNGVQEAVQVKHGITPSATSTTSIAMPFQRFFRLPFRLAGLTGTAADAASELARVYRLPVVSVPRHTPSRLITNPTRWFRAGRFADEEAAALTAERLAQGRPVLIASDSVARSERLAAVFTRYQIAHRVLNAVRHESEAAVIAAAGMPGAVTIATNMAGRGTDIALHDAARAAGGLTVITLCPGLSRRYERQMVGRAARRGQPGEHFPLASADDELLARHAPILAAIAARIMPERTNRQPWTLAAGLIVRRAQRRAERRAARLRQDLARRSASLDEALAFAGPQ